MRLLPRHGVAALLLLVSCGRGADDKRPSPDAGGVSRVDEVDVPLASATPSDVEAFDRGQAAFELPFREADGLGPLYVRPACGACHAGAARGPGSVQKMAIVDDGGVDTAADQSELAFGHTVRPLLAAGATTPIEPPAGGNVKVSLRVGPPVLGRGYLEAIADAEIERMETEQAARDDGIHGHVNRVPFTSEANPDTTFPTHQKGDAGLIGRFGVKARIATLDDFVSDALQGDMGLTSPMRPDELPNPDGLLDDAKPGIDAPIELVNGLAMYLRLVAIPSRAAPSPEAVALFERATCAVCHVPSLRTRADHPIAELADIDAPVFTDLLVHDMGVALADGMTEGTATSREMRTAPLIGLRFDRTFLHDGRASSVLDAVLAHDGEAAGAAAAFRAMTSDERASLLGYVGSL